MRTDSIEKALFSLFSEQHPIVFWDDEGGQSADLLAQLPFEKYGVTLVRRSEICDLELKVKLLLEADENERFLLYSTEATPSPEEDWLLDIRLYSKSFSLDAASMYMEELGIDSDGEKAPVLRATLVLRKKFMYAQERRKRLHKFLPKDPDNRDLDLAILTVLTHSTRASFEDICVNLFIDFYGDKTKAGQALLDGMSLMWDDIVKYGLADVFWLRAREEFGYCGPMDENGKERPTLEHFLQSLLITDMANSLGDRMPASLAYLVISSPLARMSSIFCGDWCKRRDCHTQYAAISSRIARHLGIEEALAGLHAEELGDCSTFEAVERVFARDIASRVADGDAQHLLALIDRRKALYWAEMQDDEGLALYGTIYEGLEAMLALRLLMARYSEGFAYETAARAWEHYTTEIFRFDQHYRHFCHAADQVESRADILKALRTTVESWNNWYLTELAQAWAPLLGAGELLASWRIPNVPFQSDFYLNFAAPYLRSNARSRVFVLISDGLRYEVAEELQHALNAEERLKSEITAQLSVLPSITSLGMAALLPHDTLSFKEGTANILVNDRPCEGVEQRNALLQTVQGKAIQADQFTAMKSDEARNFVRDTRVLYIYHNQIDDTGDSRSSEDRTFTAANATIGTLKKIVRFIVDRLNGSHIFITADHGFLYQDAMVAETSRAIAPPKTGVIKDKKRYILGRNLEESSAVWHGNTSVTVGTRPDASLEFCLPKGVGVFYFTGGARYNHGGAMPQEFVVPVIHVSTLSQKSVLREGVRKVDVCPLPINRIVSDSTKLTFIQTERVTDRCKPRTLSIVLSDGKRAVSDEQRLIFDSDSDDLNTRQKSVFLTLKNLSFSGGQQYWLVLRDAQDGEEIQRLPVTIDLSYQF